MKLTFAIDYNLTVHGEPKELLDRLSLWIENKCYDGHVDDNSFVIKERGRGLYDKLTDPTHVDLATTIEGQILADKTIKLSAELNTGYKIQAYCLRAAIIFLGLMIAFASFDWFYSMLTLLITATIYYLNNRSIRMRIKRDLDGFIRNINTGTSAQLK